MKWDVTIEKVINGYYVKLGADVEGRDFVVEEPETGNSTKDEQLAFRKLCWSLREVFDVTNDKHNNQYLDITVTNTDD